MSCATSLGIAWAGHEIWSRFEVLICNLKLLWPADVNSMVSLLSGWLGVALASAAEKPNGDEDTVGSLSQALAEILASLQATFAGTPLDVEISYEGGRDVSIKSPCSLCSECLTLTLTNASSISCDACSSLQMLLAGSAFGCILKSFWIGSVHEIAPQDFAAALAP